MRGEIIALHRRLKADDDLRHARPGRGDDDGRQDRRAARRARSSRSARRSSCTTRRRNQFVAGFIGSPQMNFVAGHRRRADGSVSPSLGGGRHRRPAHVRAARHGARARHPARARALQAAPGALARAGQRRAGRAARRPRADLRHAWRARAARASPYRCRASVRTAVGDALTVTRRPRPATCSTTDEAHFAVDAGVMTPLRQRRPCCRPHAGCVVLRSIAAGAARMLDPRCRDRPLLLLPPDGLARAAHLGASTPGGDVPLGGRGAARRSRLPDAERTARRQRRRRCSRSPARSCAPTSRSRRSPSPGSSATRGPMAVLLRRPRRQLAYAVSQRSGTCTTAARAIPTRPVLRPRRQDRAARPSTAGACARAQLDALGYDAKTRRPAVQALAVLPDPAGCRHRRGLRHVLRHAGARARSISAPSTTTITASTAATEIADGDLDSTSSPGPRRCADVARALHRR